MNTPPEPVDLREQITNALDPSGEMTAALSAFEQLDLLPSSILELVDSPLTDLAVLASRHRDLVEQAARAVEVLCPRGWSIAEMNTSILNQAVELVEQDRADEADELLADQWDDKWPISKVPLQIRQLGYADPDLKAIAEQRARLVTKALTHHQAGAYEASVPILLAQVEGIVIDAAAAAFFSRSPKNKADVVDATNLATIESAIGAVRKAFTEHAGETTASGKISRHGILHGRELAYDTRSTSAKCWSLLLAVAQWARPRLEEETERRRQHRQQENAGSDETDGGGRRLDDREFKETCRALTTLANSAIGWHKQRGRYRADVAGGVYTQKDFIKWGLEGKFDFNQTLSDQARTCTFWRATMSGWVLAIAVTSSPDGLYDYWYYSGTQPPKSSPLDDPDPWGGHPHRTPPDWTS